MLDDVAAAIAAALDDVADAVGNNLVVEPWFVLSPAAPTIDIYPGDQPDEDVGFGQDDWFVWEIRARVHTVEHFGAQGVLLALMEPWGDTSVRDALLSDQTLGGTVQTANLSHPSRYTVFVDQAGVSQQLGITWRLTTITLGPT